MLSYLVPCVVVLVLLEGQCNGQEGNCDECENPGIQCQSCATDEVLSNDKKQCKACPTGCAECTIAGSTTTCTTCNTNYGLKTGGTCTACPANCAECTIAGSTTTCNTCNTNYGLKAGTCTECPSNCKTCTYTGATATCDDCNDAYDKNDDGDCVYCTGDTDDNEKCQSCGTNGKCEKCKQQYILIGEECKYVDEMCEVPAPWGNENEHGICIDCIEDYGVKYAIVCEACPSNCQTCTFPDGDPSCTDCNDGYYKDTNDECVLCGVMNCESCTDAVTCDTCDDTSIKASNDECRSCTSTDNAGSDQNCATCTAAIDADTVVCTACVVGYALDNDAKCASCTSTDNAGSDQNCATCTANGADADTVVCTACVAGYALDNDVKCASCTTGAAGSDSHCDTCTANGLSNTVVCTACVSGYGLDGNNLCAELSDNCVSCAAQGGSVCASICTGCDSGFDLFTRYCAECPDNCNDCTLHVGVMKCNKCDVSFFVSNGGCTACTDNCQECNDENKCIEGKCEPAYAVNGNGKCVACPALTQILNCAECIGEKCIRCTDSHILKDEIQEKSAGAECVAIPTEVDCGSKKDVVDKNWQCVKSSCNPATRKCHVCGNLDDETFVAKENCPTNASNQQLTDCSTGYCYMKSTKAPGGVVNVAAGCLPQGKNCDNQERSCTNPNGDEDEVCDLCCETDLCTKYALNDVLNDPSNDPATKNGGMTAVATINLPLLLLSSLLSTLMGCAAAAAATT